MNETLDNTIKYTVLIAKDDIDAKRKLVFQQKEIHVFYRQTFGYPLEDELAFARLVYKFEQAAAHEKPLIVAQMMQMVQELWYKKYEHHPSGKGKESCSRAVFEEIDRLRRAVGDGDEKMCGYCLNYLWGEDSDGDGSYFRKFLAELNNAEYWKIAHFEKYLVKVASEIRYLSKIESDASESDAYELDNDFERLGLDVAKEYLDDSVPEVRMAWLTDLILLLLFDVLILGAKILPKTLSKMGFFLRFRAKRRWAPWLLNLTLLRNETASRCYDSSEIIRRLKSYEDAKGAYIIPSLVYPLLELQVRK